MSAKIDPRGLNRATLARQHLLARAADGPHAVIGRLVGLQAQLARPPFLGLWTRIAGFRADALLVPLRTRRVVRATAMRGTLHLLTAEDYARFRPVLAPMLEAGLKGVLRDRVAGLDLPALAREARAFLAEAPRPFDAIRDHLATLHPDGDVRAMGYAVRMTMPFVQVPTEAAWGFPGQADVAPADLGEDAPGTLEELVLRYLAGYGPASPADFQAWSGIRGAAPVFRALADRLVELDADGRKLWDLPDAPRPGDVAAPVRLLPDFDGLVLGHADRTRVVDDAHRPAVVTKNLQVKATFLVDGRVAGTWRIERKKRLATVVFAPFAPLPRSARAELEAEAEAAARFAEPDAPEVAIEVG